MIIIQWTAEFFYWLTNALTHLIPFVEPGKPISDATEKTAIVILSPSFTGPILYYSAKKYIEKKGFYTVVVNFSKEMEDMETAAPKLKTLIEELNHPNVCLVGISAAGIVVYEYLNTLGGWNKIDTFIALATPFKGTNMAYFEYHQKTGKQLIPSSKYLSRISKIKPKNLDKTFCIVAKEDELVPRKSSVLPGAHLIELPLIGHVRLHAFSEITFDTIIKIAKEKRRNLLLSKITTTIKRVIGRVIRH